MSEIDQIKQALKGKKTRPQTPRMADYLSTGSTLLNLACSGKANGGFRKGLYTLLVGDSSSGKSWLTMTCLAEAARNSVFKSYRFIHDNAENGVLMDVARYFGQEVASRLEPPAGTRDDPVCSSTVEEFYYHFHDAARGKRPFIYILDSMDALDTEDDEDKFRKRKSASRKGKEAAGSYGTSKAKANSSGMRRVCNQLKETGSILIVTSQTRDNIGFGAQYHPKTRAGGRAMRFYARIEIWTSVREVMRKKFGDQKVKMGMLSQVEVVKNHLTGWEGKVEVPIYRSSGIDDVGGMVHFLSQWGHWEVVGKKEGEPRGFLQSRIVAPEFKFEGPAEKLVRQIEDNNAEKELRNLVSDVWAQVEEQCSVQRKSRYT